MAPVKSFVFADVDLIINGIRISGFSEDSEITIGRNNPIWTDGVGSDGEGYRGKSSDKSGICTFNLLQTSASNDVLSQLAKQDEDFGTGIGDFMLKDRSGRSLYQAETGWLENYAEAAFGKEKNDREWVWKTNELDVKVGGN